MRPIDADRLKGQTMLIGFTTGDNFRKMIDAQPTIENKTVVEYCPNCETEIEMRWDIESMGYKAFCPVCGKRLMLCDECQHRTGGACTEDCDYDSRTDTCRFNPEHFIVNEDMFGKYVEIPTGFRRALHTYKVVCKLQSNSYCDVPLGTCDTKETVHKEIVPILQVIHCGVDETKVIRVALADCKVIDK